MCDYVEICLLNAIDMLARLYLYVVEHVLPGHVTDFQRSVFRSRMSESLESPCANAHRNRFINFIIYPVVFVDMVDKHLLGP